MPDDVYAAIRAGLAANLAGLPVNVSSYMQSNPEPPTVEIYADEEIPHLAMGAGIATINFTARALVSYASGPQESQALLDTLRANAGPKSLLAAIESDKTLGGACDDLIVRTKSEDRLYPIGGVTYLGFECAIEILT